MSEKIKITFPDGNNKEVDKGINGLELASQISKSLAKESVAIKINNEIKDISLPINSDASVAILKRDSEEALELIRHDCAHVMAEAVQILFPDTQVTIGPAIENGFYYDFAKEIPFTTSDLKKPPRHPMNFKEKVRHMIKVGIPKNRIIQAVSYTHLTLPTTPYV